MSSYIYGIDFGTSNSVLAILDIKKNEVVKIFSEASIIYFKSAGNYCVGNKAINEYIENGLQGRLLKSVKTLLPQTSFTFTFIFGIRYSAEDLVALILSNLKAQADDFLGENIDTVVLGRPVVFSEDPTKDKFAEKRLNASARKAGFTSIFFQFEPIAAGFLYEQKIQSSEKVLIGDFGGGTSDFTIMNLGKDSLKARNRKKDIIKTGGIHIGGDDFDSSIMWNKIVPYFGFGVQYESYGKMLDLPVHIFRTLCQWEQMAFLKEGNLRKKLNVYYLYTNRNPAIARLIKLIDYNFGYSIFRAIERAKIELSDRESSMISFHNEHVDLQHEIKSNEFNSYIAKDIEAIKVFIKGFLSDEKPENIKHVFLTGGTSSLLSIQNLFKELFDNEIIEVGEKFSSVARGLALSYQYLSAYE